MTTIDDRADALVSRARELQLDTLWERVNALGGWHDKTDATLTAREAAISEVLKIIEEMGGRDPLTRDQRAHGQEKAA